MAWDVIVTDTLVEMYIQATSSTAGVAAEGAADRKDLKYQSLVHTHAFFPLAFETLGPINSKGSAFSHSNWSTPFSLYWRHARSFFLISTLVINYTAL